MPGIATNGCVLRRWRPPHGRTVDPPLLLAWPGVGIVVCTLPSPTSAGSLAMPCHAMPWVPCRSWRWALLMSSRRPSDKPPGLASAFFFFALPSRIDAIHCHDRPLPRPGPISPALSSVVGNASSSGTSAVPSALRLASPNLNLARHPNCSLAPSESIQLYACSVPFLCWRTLLRYLHLKPLPSVEQYR